MLTPLSVPTPHYNVVVREMLTAARTYYVRTDGNDANDGLTNVAGGAFLTIQHAVDIASELDSAGFNVTIQVADGTYAEPLITCKDMLGSGSVTIHGNTVTPTNVIVDGGFTKFAAGTTYALRDFGLIKNTSWNGTAITTTVGGFIIFSGLDFGAGFTIHVSPDQNGSIRADGNYTISGSATYHYAAANTGVFEANAITITIVGALVFVIFALAQDLGLLRTTALNFVGACTGTRYFGNGNAVIQTFGGGANFFPGNVGGAVINGAQYL